MKQSHGVGSHVRSRWHLQREFRKATGLSPAEYARAVRQQRLQQQLKRQKFRDGRARRATKLVVDPVALVEIIEDAADCAETEEAADSSKDQSNAEQQSRLEEPRIAGEAAGRRGILDYAEVR